MMNGTDELEVITTPTFDWLERKAVHCQSQMIIASPYVNDGITGITNMVGGKVSRTLVTRTDLRDFALGSSNLETLCALAREGVSIRSLSDLHAKIYIFDKTCALVTSANATFSGMHRNLECGLATTNVKIIEQLRRQLLRGFGGVKPLRVMREKELQALREPLADMQVAITPRFKQSIEKFEADIEDAQFSVVDENAFVKNFKGWQRLTLQGVVEVQRETFRLEDLVRVCRPVASHQYPNNHFVPDKLRQQLQILRDIGLIEFVERGLYKRTFAINDHTQIDS